MDNANPQTALISIAAQIQPEAEAQPVASSEAGELLPCPFCSSSQIEDVMRTGAVVCQDCRASATNNRQWNRRALPAARAEVSVAEADDLLNIAKDSVEILQVAIDNWNEIHPDEPDEIFTDLQSRCRALTEAGE